MANYMIRVELHGAVEKNYEDLHEAMASMGFKRTITSDTGKECELPTGMYNIASTKNRKEITDLAKTVAITISKNLKTEKSPKYMLIVTEGNSTFVLPTVVKN
jgi:Endoribonuclease GhoS